MEREEIERVERELDAILKLVQPEPTMQDKAREEALSKEPASGGDKTTSEEYLTEESTLEAYLFGEDTSEENASEYDAADKYAADSYIADRYTADEYTSEEDEYGMEEEVNA